METQNNVWKQTAACWKYGCKENCVLSSYSVPTVLYTEVLKRNIQYFSRMGIWVQALLHVNSVNLTIIYVWIKCILSSKMQIILLRFKSEKQQWVLERTDTWLKVIFMQTANTLTRLRWYSNQTTRMSRLIWVYAGQTCNLVQNAGDDNKHDGDYTQYCTT